MATIMSPITGIFGDHLKAVAAAHGLAWSDQTIATLVSRKAVRMEALEEDVAAVARQLDEKPAGDALALLIGGPHLLYVLFFGVFCV